MWPIRTLGNHTSCHVLALLVNDDKPWAEDTEEAGADEDGHGDEEHEHVDIVRLLQVKVGRNKVTLAGSVEAGESRLGCVVSTIVAKVSVVMVHRIKESMNFHRSKKTYGRRCTLPRVSLSSPRGSSSACFPCRSWSRSQTEGPLARHACRSLKCQGLICSHLFWYSFLKVENLPSAS